MKKNFKIFAAMLAVSVLAFVFASCSNGSSDESSTSSNGSTSDATLVATYKTTDGDNWKAYRLYSNNEIHQAVKQAESLVKDGVIKKGTYTKTGDVFSNCTITVTWKEEIKNQTRLEFTPVTEDTNQSMNVTNGTLSVTNNNKENIFTLQK